MLSQMPKRTPKKSAAANGGGRATRTPLAVVDANINNVHVRDDPTTSAAAKTPFKPQKVNNNTKKKGTTVISSTKKKRSKSMTRRNDSNCDICTTTTTSVPVQNNIPFHAAILDSVDEKHLHSLTIPINESFHIYESDGEDALFESFATAKIDIETENVIDVDKCKASTEISIQPTRTTYYYSAQQWEEEQCSMFASWLNKLFYPEDETTVNTMSDEEITAEWNSAKQLFDSSPMQSIRKSVEREVKEGRLAIVPPRTDRFILDEVYVQEQLTKLLLSYTPRWLQLGLGIVLALNNGGQIIQVSLQHFYNSLCIFALIINLTSCLSSRGGDNNR
jgi:hypothetical protein